jgi:hypothetical protein
MFVGLFNGNMRDGSFVGFLSNSYAINDYSDYCWLSGKSHPFEWSNRALRPKWKGPENIIGCGLLLNSENALSIFFTENGILMGQFLRDSSII